MFATSASQNYWALDPKCNGSAEKRRVICINAHITATRSLQEIFERNKKESSSYSSNYWHAKRGVNTLIYKSDRDVRDQIWIEVVKKGQILLRSVRWLLFSKISSFSSEIWPALKLQASPWISGCTDNSR